MKLRDDSEYFEPIFSDGRIILFPKSSRQNCRIWGSERRQQLHYTLEITPSIMVGVPCHNTK